jgi:hypothetical protein
LIKKNITKALFGNDNTFAYTQLPLSGAEYPLSVLERIFDPPHTNIEYGQVFPTELFP